MRPLLGRLKAEVRRLRRGREVSDKRGQGHGKRTYVGVRPSAGSLATEELRERRREALVVRRSREDALRAKTIQRVAKRKAKAKRDA